MRIGYFIPEFPGQTHSFFWREIMAMEALGADVVLLSTRPPPARSMAHDWAAEARARTAYLAPLTPRHLSAAIARLHRTPLIEALRVRDRGLAATAAALAAFLPFAGRLADICAERGVEHLHLGSCGRAAWIAAIARRLGGPPYSLTLHNPLSVFGPEQPFKWRGAAFGAAITQTLLAELRTRLSGHLPLRLTVQSMGVDTDRFRRSTPYVPWTPGEPLRLFSCARLNRAKGHAVAAEAVALLAGRGVDARLEIAGEDDAGGRGYRATLEAAIAALGVADRVTLLGAVGEPAVRAALEQAHVFVLASDAEPLGVAYMEAMSCETPVVGTAAGGVAELVDTGHDGLLVPSRDPQAVADAVERIARDQALARSLSSAGRLKVAVRFDAKRGAEVILRLAQKTSN